MATKNLGQVAGVFIGTTPPENVTLIWYDNTPNQMLHKVYDVNLAQWVVLDKNTISSITYSELVNLATTVGLSIGAWFKITDRGNSLALAITSTKVQYDDVLGNILIDDLGTNVQYHVTSSNLSIDDVIGVFDVVNKKLVFQFNEQTPDYTADDYILGKVKRNNVWSLAKYKLSSFLSKVTGNSITWNGGFFFNFNNAIHNILDQSGGVVAKDTYDIDLQNLNAAINNVGEENQTIIENAQTALEQATTDTAIYNKKVPTDLVTGGEPLDVVKNDTLHTAISKIQRWINRFKYATGIKISDNFAPSQTAGNINNNDTVDSAFRKVQKYMNDIGGGSIPEIKKGISYDYIVDSNEKLIGLVRNPLATTVLIKRGIWVFDFGTNTNNLLVLHENTTLIHCEDEAYIKFVGDNNLRENGSNRSLITRESFSGKPIREYCDIKVITDIIQKTSGGVNVIDIIFSNLSNLYRCEYYNEIKQITSYAFKNCNNLFACTTKVLGREAFVNCNFLNRCFINKNSLSINVLACFRYCNDLYGCYCEGVISQGSKNFVTCKRMSNCWVKISTSSTSIVEGFSNCSYLTNCNSEIIPNDINSNSGVNFQSCKMLNNCEVRGLTSYANIKGFYLCGGVSHCASYGLGIGQSFPQSYAQSGTLFEEIYLCSNTPDGGFNFISTDNNG